MFCLHINFGLSSSPNSDDPTVQSNTSRENVMACQWHTDPKGHEESRSASGRATPAALPRDEAFRWFSFRLDGLMPQGYCGNVEKKSPGCSEKSGVSAA